jgi:diguanylate cyclase (GGDEF)-like protein
MQGMKAMNARMQDEIRVREETERRLKEALAQVERMSIEDELTGLRNRRGFLTLAEQEILLLRRQRNPFMILFADVDGLKCINDTYGHKDGDDAIRGAAKALKAALRESDVVARIGGDEFTALIVDAKEENSKVIHERIDSRLAEVNRALCRPWRLSLSVGFYCVSEDCREDVNWMMSRADEELYRRKQEKKRP